MGAGRNAMSTSAGLCAQNRKDPKKSKGFRQGIWSAQSSPVERNRVSMLERCSSERVDHLISEPSKLACRGLAIAFALWFIAAMAIVTRKERAIPPRSLRHGASWRDYGELIHCILLL